MSEAPQQALSPAEWRIMKILWDRRRATNQDILMDLSDEAPISGHRQMNVHLSRMIAKGYVSVDDAKRPYLYTPRIDRESVVRQASRQFIDEVLRGDPQDVRILGDVVTQRLNGGP